MYTGLTLLLNFIIPLVILVATYLLTFRSISYSEKHLFPSKAQPTETTTTTIDCNSSRNNNHQGTIEQVAVLVKTSYANRQKLLQRAKYKSLRMSVLIILAFIVCWTPYYIMMVIFIFTNVDEKVSKVFLILLL